MEKKTKRNVLISMILSVILAFGMTEAAYCGSFTHTDTGTHTATGIVNLTVSEEYSIQLPALLSLVECRDDVGNLYYEGNVEVSAKLRILPSSCIHVEVLRTNGAGTGCSFQSKTVRDGNGNAYEVDALITNYSSVIYSVLSADRNVVCDCSIKSPSGCKHLSANNSYVFIPNDGLFHDELKLCAGKIRVNSNDIVVPDEYVGTYTVQYYLAQ